MKILAATVATLGLFCSGVVYAEKECEQKKAEDGTFDLIAISLGAKAEQEHKDDFTAPAEKKGKKIPWTLKDKLEIAEFVEDIMKKAKAARHDQGKTKLNVQSKKLANGRLAWWEDKTGTIVIFNPKKEDCGTAYRPDKGKENYDEQT